MEDPRTLTAVAEFHGTFKHPILTKPQIPKENRCQLRVSLLAEELNELQEGILNKDIIEVADALCDIQYVLSGAILEFGLADKFKALFDEVQRSNMSKACKNIQEAEATLEHYKSSGIECFYKQEGDLFLVYRQEDNKTLKSINYSPADIRGILEK